MSEYSVEVTVRLRQTWLRFISRRLVMIDLYANGQKISSQRAWRILT